MDFHFLVMEKSWKINVEKEGAPWSTRVKCTSVNCDQSCRTAVRPQSSLIFWSVIITVCWCDASDIADCAKCTGEIFHIGDAFSTCLPMRSVIVCWSSFNGWRVVMGTALVLGTSVLETSLKHLLPAVSARDIVLYQNIFDVMTYMWHRSHMWPMWLVEYGRLYFYFTVRPVRAPGL